MKKSRTAYFRNYYKQKKELSGKKTRPYKKHKNETLEQKVERLRIYQREYAKKWYHKNKAKRQENCQEGKNKNCQTDK